MTREPFRLETQPRPHRTRGDARCLTCGEILSVQDMETDYCGEGNVAKCRLEAV